MKNRVGSIRLAEETNTLVCDCVVAVYWRLESLVADDLS